MRLVFELEAEDYDRLVAGKVPYLDIAVTDIEARHGIEQVQLPVRFVEGISRRVMQVNGTADNDLSPGIRVWLRSPEEEENDGSGNR